jgi:hypothetical protein
MSATEANQEALARVAERFYLPIEAVLDIAFVSPEILVERSRAAEETPVNGTAPHSCPRHDLGAVRVYPYGGPLSDRYVDYLRVFDARELVNAEAEQDIKTHPTYARYLDWARSGLEPPYIAVYQTDKGRLQSANRRRTLVAQELGKEITGWYGPHNAETDLPLKFGDVMAAIHAEMDLAQPKTKKPSEPGF